MIIGWIITKNHASGYTEFVEYRDDNIGCQVYKFFDKPSMATIFRIKPDSLFDLICKECNDDIEMVPVECYF
jgi:hypothetical protein